MNQPTTPPARSTVTSGTLRDVVELACTAPSVHNTQPWSWRVGVSTLELFADRRRSLTVTDPRGRHLAVSCGAALHQAQVAARALGWLPVVSRMPDAGDRDLLARIELSPAAPTSADRRAAALLHDRRTDRRRFTSWPIPDGRLHGLAATAERWGVVASALTDPDRLWKVEELLARAYEIEAADPRAAAEQAAWIDRSAADGVPAQTVPDRPQVDTGRRSRFGSGHLEDADREIETTDRLIVLGTVDDDQGGWLRAGEALSALWLDATSSGLAVVPLSQPIEVRQTRLALQRDVLTSLAVPHVLVRIGWPSIVRTALPPVARRPLDDVLR